MGLHTRFRGFNEGVRVVSEFTPETSILITILFDTTPPKIDSLNISPESWSARMRSLFEDPRMTQDIASHKGIKNGRLIHLIGSLNLNKFSVDYAAWGATAAWPKVSQELWMAVTQLLI